SDSPGRQAAATPTSPTATPARSPHPDGSPTSKPESTSATQRSPGARVRRTKAGHASLHGATSSPAVPTGHGSAHPASSTRTATPSRYVATIRTGRDAADNTDSSRRDHHAPRRPGD